MRNSSIWRVAGSGWAYPPPAKCYPLSWPHQREKNYISNRGRISQNHRQPVNAHSFAGGGGHSVLQRPDVILVGLMRFFVAALALGELLCKAARLFVGVVEL